MVKTKTARMKKTRFRFGTPKLGFAYYKSGTNRLPKGYKRIPETFVNSHPAYWKMKALSKSQIRAGMADYTGKRPRWGKYKKYAMRKK